MEIRYNNPHVGVVIVTARLTPGGFIVRVTPDNNAYETAVGRRFWRAAAGRARCRRQEARALLGQMAQNKSL